MTLGSLYPAPGQTRAAWRQDTGSFIGTAIDNDKLALMFETRDQPHLTALTLHMIMVAPLEWPFLIVGSEENLATLRKKDTIRALEGTGKLRLDTVDPRWPVHSQEALSIAFNNLSFWDHYVGDAEHLLIWQSDSIMCANAERSLNDWLEYDWVGAPRPEYQFGGNGGFSLRRMSAIREIARAYAYDRTIDPDAGYFEDGFFIRKMLKGVDGKVFTPAPKEVERDFSVESIFEPNPMAYHIGWNGRRIFSSVWQDPNNWSKNVEWCPEVKMILPTVRNPPQEGEVCTVPG